MTLCIGITLAYLVAAVSPTLPVANAALPSYVVTLLFFTGAAHHPCSLLANMHYHDDAITCGTHRLHGIVVHLCARFLCGDGIHRRMSRLHAAQATLVRMYDASAASCCAYT